MRVVWEENLFQAFTPATNSFSLDSHPPTSDWGAATNSQISSPYVPPKLSTSSSLRSAARRCRSPPSSSPEVADPVVLADATDVSHLGYLRMATARKVIPFVARTAAKRQSVQLVRSPFESPQSCFSYHQSRFNLTGAFHMVWLFRQELNF